MLSLATGHDCDYLTKAVAAGREGYYTGAVAAGEPAGRWHGAGAERLGLTGEVAANVMAAVYKRLQDPRDPEATLGTPHRQYRSAEKLYEAALAAHPDASPEERDEMRAQAARRARQPVSFIDATFSAPKSVTVLGVALERAENDARQAGDEEMAAVWGAHRQAVEDAVTAGATATVDYLSDVAGFARIGRHGGASGRWVDAHDWVVAQFLQHDSRERDPQLHVHQAILNRVQDPDGTWRTLDSRAIHNHRGAASAIGERVMEAHLAATLGVRIETRPDGKAREIVGVDQEVMRLFSTRRRAITGKAAQLVAEFTTRFGREPSLPERNRISQQATLATRATKAHDGETNASRVDRWERETREVVAGGLSHVAQQALAQDPAAGVQVWDAADVTDRALAAVSAERQTWTRSDLLRAVSDALPGQLDIAPGQVRELLDGLTDRALADAIPVAPPVDTDGLPDELRLADGTAGTARPGAARYTTPTQLVGEQRLRDAAVARVDAIATVDEAAEDLRRLADGGLTLGADQAAAVAGVLSSGAQVQVIAAPAGSGKSYVVGAATSAWAARGGRVLGLAPSQAAAKVLSEEGVPAMNLARWRGEVARGQQDVRAGDLLVVDEAGMASTQDLLEVVNRAQAAGATVVLVGDDRQLAAVGPGGALGDVAARAQRYELAEVRRFNAEWERAASLRLREGDTGVLGDYDRHGRLVDAGTVEQAEAAAGRAWLADTVAGRQSLLLVGSNEAAARLSGELRGDLVELGLVEEHGVPLGRDGNVAGVGDLVQARRNDWNLGTPAINRVNYRVREVLADGGLRVEPVGGGEEMVLPAAYVTADLTLAYAATVHAAQGRTVDTAHAVLGAGTRLSALYVALTRGRDGNTAWTVTRAVGEDAQTGETHASEPRTARAVLADVLDADDEVLTALGEQEQAEAEAVSVQTNVERLAAEVGIAIAGRTGRMLDQLTADGVLTPTQREGLAADQATPALDRLLRTAELAGHDPQQVLADAAAARGFSGARSVAQILHHRIRESDLDLTPRLLSARDMIPGGVSDEWTAWLEKRADTIDARRHDLAAQVAAEQPQWARETLGPVPEDPIERAEWEHRAGWAAAHREAAGLDTDDDVLGAAPPAGVAEKHAIWRTAHTELDMPDAGADEALMSDGQLRLRVAIFHREQTWAPRWVGDELAATEQQLAARRDDATLWAARADILDDEAEAAQLRSAAAEAAEEAERLAGAVAALTEVDSARARWWANTAVTRDNAERARAELGTRGVDLDAADERVTAQEWLAAHRAAQAEDDQRHELDETELAAPAEDLAGDLDDLPADVTETAVPDIRGTAVIDPTERADPGDTRRRVPSVDETAAAVQRARDALAEIEQRNAADEAAQRLEETARWAEQTEDNDAAAAADDSDLVDQR